LIPPLIKVEIELVAMVPKKSKRITPSK
jgi:hypothetical protein